MLDINKRHVSRYVRWMRVSLRINFRGQIFHSPTSNSVSTPNTFVTNVAAMQDVRHGIASEATLLASRAEGGVTCCASPSRVGRLKQTFGT